MCSSPLLLAARLALRVPRKGGTVNPAAQKEVGQPGRGPLRQQRAWAQLGLFGRPSLQLQTQVQIPASPTEAFPPSSRCQVRAEGPATGSAATGLALRASKAVRAFPSEYKGRFSGGWFLALLPQ